MVAELQMYRKYVFVKRGCPRWQQSPNMAKFVSPKFWPRPNPRGMWCQWSVRNPWMNLQSKFGYTRPPKLYILRFVYKWDGITDGQTDGRTDDPNTRCPRRTFQAGGIKTPSYWISAEQITHNLNNVYFSYLTALDVWQSITNSHIRL